MYQGHLRKEVHVYWRKLGNGKRVPQTEASAAGQELLGIALWDLFRIELGQAKMEKGIHGKPYLAEYQDVEFNISHSGCYVVCAVSGVPVGIDIQEKRIISLDKLGRKIFSPEEYCEFLKSEEKQDIFFRQWTCMESYLKWTGDGISKGLKNLKMDGWHQFIHLNKNYLCVVWSQGPLSVTLKEV